MTRTNMLFWFYKEWPQYFLTWVYYWKLIWKLVLYWGNCHQFGAFARQFQYRPIQPNLPRQMKSHIAYQCFLYLIQIFDPDCTSNYICKTLVQFYLLEASITRNQVSWVSASTFQIKHNFSHLSKITFYFSWFFDSSMTK